MDAANLKPPQVGGIRAGPPLAAMLYLLLVGSAVLSLWAHRFPGALPRMMGFAAPWVFLAFTAVFAVYRFALVRARKYAASKAFFQIGAALCFFALLLPRVGPAEVGRDSLEALLTDADPRVRALAAEVAGYRPEGGKVASRLVRALEDPEPAVREQAHASLVRLAGTDLGAPEDATGLKAWKDHFP
jgi:hypothetical protein